MVPEHGQKRVYCRSSELSAELGHIAFHERSDECPPPSDAIDVGIGQRRPWEPTPDPKLRHLRGTDLGDLETRQLDVFNVSGQRLGALAQQTGSSAAEHEKPRRVTLAIEQHAQDRKQIGPVLHFVDDDDASEVSKCGQGLVEPSQTDGILDVEIVGRTCGYELPS